MDALRYCISLLTIIRLIFSHPAGDNNSIMEYGDPGERYTVLRLRTKNMQQFLFVRKLFESSVDLKVSQAIIYFTPAQVVPKLAEYCLVPLLGSCQEVPRELYKVFSSLTLRYVYQHLGGLFFDRCIFR